MKKRFAALLVAVALSPAGGRSLSAAPPEQSATVAPPTAAVTTHAIEGRFRYAGGRKQQQKLFEAIDVAIEDMNMFIRPIARSRLRKSNLPSPQIEIDVQGPRVTVRRPGVSSITSPVDGTPVRWKSPEGDVFKVSQRLTAGKLVQRFVGSQSDSSNVFKLHKDGSRMTVTTRIKADRLPNTVRFFMSYSRR